MNVIDPKADFLAFTPLVAERTRKEFPQPWFREACNASLAQLMNHGVSSEELSGVRKFLNILVNIGETTPEPARLPVKTLDEPDDIAAKLAEK